MVKQEQPAAERAALQEAALSAYGKRADASHAAQVQTLQRQVTELSQNIERDQDGAAEQISRMWDQVTQFAG